MYQIQNLTSDPKQTQVLVLPDGTQITFTIYYSSQQLGWFITDLLYGSFEVKGVRITNNANILYQFRNQIPFGLYCVTAGAREPTLPQDFSSGASQLFILTAAEVAQYVSFLSD
jgi:hypothetical protein